MRRKEDHVDYQRAAIFCNRINLFPAFPFLLMTYMICHGSNEFVRRMMELYIQVARRQMNDAMKKIPRKVEMN